MSRATELSSRSYLAFNPAQRKSNRPSILPAPVHQPRKQLPKAEVAADSNGDSVAVIRQKAQKTTAALVQNFKFRTTYGFMPNDEYSLAVQTGGAPPNISPDDLPPRFEQYLVVEVTISIDGKVVDARIAAGQVDQKIQDRVLAAIREYKYVPAKHNGSPIPSQVDLVIHVPS
ncbi:MAG TPA: energy transducer TonB [Candidatus Angelobacter sp.]